MARIQAAVLFDGVRGPRALFSGLGDFRWLGIGVFDFLLEQLCLISHDH
jgi:hypothetical protein